MDLFIPNDKLMNSFFRNKGGGKFEEVGFEENVALREDGVYISGMGVGFPRPRQRWLSRHRHRRARWRNVSALPEHRQRQLHRSHARERHDEAQPAHGGIFSEHRRLRQ